jgi:hypothetical protein
MGWGIVALLAFGVYAISMAVYAVVLWITGGWPRPSRWPARPLRNDERDAGRMPRSQPADLFDPGRGWGGYGPPHHGDQRTFGGYGSDTRSSDRTE